MSLEEELQEEHADNVVDDIDDEEAGKFDKNESFAEEAIPKVSLDKSIIADCISMPYRLGYGFSHAFVKLDCSDKRLMDCDILRQYIHLRFVILSNNYITDICPVSVIGHLIYLKADNNQITSADCLNSLRFLQFLDLSGNKLTSISNLSCPFLQHLKVNDNKIETLMTNYGSEIPNNQLPSLHTLELRSNSLTDLNGLGGLISLKSLYCAENMLKSISGVGQLNSLVRIHLRDNAIRSLDGFTSALSSLEYINLRGNRISKFREVKKLAQLPSLVVLLLMDNPVAEKDNYRLITVGCINRLERLDKDRVTDNERVQSSSYAQQADLEEEGDEQLMEESHNVAGIGEDLGENKLEEEQGDEDAGATAEEEEEEEEEDN